MTLLTFKHFRLSEKEGARSEHASKAPRPSITTSGILFAFAFTQSDNGASLHRTTLELSHGSASAKTLVRRKRRTILRSHRKSLKNKDFLKQSFNGLFRLRFSFIGFDDFQHFQRVRLSRADFLRRHRPHQAFQIGRHRRQIVRRRKQRRQSQHQPRVGFRLVGGSQSVHLRQLSLRLDISRARRPVQPKNRAFVVLFDAVAVGVQLARSEERR